MKLSKLYENILIEDIGCPFIKITKEIENEVKKFNSDEELLKSGGISTEALDRAAFGFSEGDVKSLSPKELDIKWKTDYENVIWEIKKSELNKIQWASKINLNEPIDVVYEKGRFFIDDGHHRYVAAKILNKNLNVNLLIKDNPILKLTPTLNYDEFHRCLFNQVKKL